LLSEPSELDDKPSQVGDVPVFSASAQRVAVATSTAGKVIGTILSIKAGSSGVM